MNIIFKNIIVVILSFSMTHLVYSNDPDNILVDSFQTKVVLKNPLNEKVDLLHLRITKIFDDNLIPKGSLGLTYDVLSNSLFASRSEVKEVINIGNNIYGITTRGSWVNIVRPVVVNKDILASVNHFDTEIYNLDFHLKLDNTVIKSINIEGYVPLKYTLNPVTLIGQGVESDVEIGEVKYGDNEAVFTLKTFGDNTIYIHLDDVFNVIGARISDSEYFYPNIDIASLSGVLTVDLNERYKLGNLRVSLDAFNKFSLLGKRNQLLYWKGELGVRSESHDFVVFYSPEDQVIGVVPSIMFAQMFYDFNNEFISILHGKECIYLMSSGIKLKRELTFEKQLWVILKQYSQDVLSCSLSDQRRTTFELLRNYFSKRAVCEINFKQLQTRLSKEFASAYHDSIKKERYTAAWALSSNLDRLGGVWLKNKHVSDGGVTYIGLDLSKGLNEIDILEISNFKKENGENQNITKYKSRHIIGGEVVQDAF